ncbi:hypothetical protein [Kordia jejudonensis]|uniref:hypothetical protein n=1 Tax=Kordia jejudonensis TaxID=1348245 RepID=UPI00062988D8|nr:hypothetical protein [Kordia jejudonensis]
MKTIKLITFKLMLLFLTTTLFTNCESDTALETQDELVAVAKQAPFSSHMVYTSEIENNALISERLRGLTQNRNQVSIENDNNDFSVETKVAKYVEKNDGSGYSYTFAISRENEFSTALENLVLSVNAATQEISTVLMKYQYSAEQLHELLNTGHVSSYVDITVTPIEGDFSSLLSENSLPCTISTTTYHVTPTINGVEGGTYEYGPHSTCHHQGGADGECEVYTVTSVWCPPTSPGGAGTTTTTTSGDPSSATDPTNNTTSGGTTTSPTTSDPNEPSDEIVTTPIVDQLTIDLNGIKQGNDSWGYSKSPMPTGTPTFNSVEEFELYLETIDEIEGDMSFEDTSSPDIKIASFIFPLTWNSDLKVKIYQQMGDFFQQVPYEVTSVESVTTGLDFHLFWEQQDSFGFSMNPTQPYGEARIVQYGTLKIGAVIEGRGLYFNREYIIIMYVNSLTGQPVRSIFGYE